MRTPTLAGFVLSFGLAAAACREQDLPDRFGAPITNPDAGGGPAASLDDLAAPGPFGVGTREYTFVDASRATPANGTYAGDAVRTLPTRIWYPAPVGADGDGADVAPRGPFPVILYAHGFLSSRVESGDLKQHLASHGYVVIAPDFPLSNGNAPGGPTFRDLSNQPGDLTFVLSSARALGGADQPLADALDRTLIGVAGLSLGGATTLLAVYHPELYVPGVRAAVAFAPPACFFGDAMYVRSVPTVVLGGSSDELVPFDSIQFGVARVAPPPLEVVKLVGATHTGFLGIQIPDAGNTDGLLGCGPVQAAVGTDTNPPWAAALGEELDRGTTGHVLQFQACGPVCGTPYVATMPGQRQLVLTRAITLAAFESVLHGRPDAARFLSDALARQNTDVNVVRAR
ncbi:MAG TPA: hypothetical protein VHE30_02535 [Polyangiaceae bacterium]|nr:hypothetical protein [Polyangiaceae bacterium]